VDASLRSETIRISFPTPAPYYPYFEPRRPPLPAGESVPARLLELWVVSPARVTPISARTVDGKTSWVSPMLEGGAGALTPRAHRPRVRRSMERSPVSSLRSSRRCRSWCKPSRTRSTHARAMATSSSRREDRSSHAGERREATTAPRDPRSRPGARDGREAMMARVSAFLLALSTLFMASCDRRATAPPSDANARRVPSRWRTRPRLRRARRPSPSHHRSSRPARGAGQRSIPGGRERAVLALLAGARVRRAPHVATDPGHLFDPSQRDRVAPRRVRRA